jgi:hypothetical protein
MGVYNSRYFGNVKGYFTGTDLPFFRGFFFPFPRRPPLAPILAM